MEETKKDFAITGNDTKSSDEKIICEEDLTSVVTISHSNENVNTIESDFITFDSRTPKEIDWLWKPYIVRGNINIIQGDGGLGKSYLITWLLSAISTGSQIPFSNENFKIGNSILQNAEDDIDATILPRLNLNGADCSKIGIINEEEKAFSIQQLERLEEKVKKFKPEVVVLDPIQAYLGNVNMNSTGEVREALKPLKIIAQKYNCAIILIMHLNKNAGVTKATHRTMGSIDFVSASRSVMLIAENPEKKEERLFIPIKTNLMKENEKRTLSFKITDRGIIEWKEDKGYINANDVLNQEENSFNKDSITKGFILGVLSKEDLTSTELENLVLEKGNISLKSYNITKANLRKEEKIDYYQKNKKYYWTLKTNNKGDAKND